MSARFYEFGPFRVDTVNHVLLRNGETIPLKPKVFDTLLVLVENRTRVLDKDELMSRLWPDTVVEESNLTQNVYLLRKVLGEEPEADAYIETMPKRGYRFVASVNEVDPASTNLIVEEHSRSRLFIEHEDDADVALKFAAEAEQSIQAKALTAGRWEKQASWWKLGAIILGVCILGLGLTIALSYFWTKSKSTATARATSIRSIAVLPFKPLGTDPSDDYLGLGMADTLITRLSRMNQIVVRPTSAVRKFTSPNQDLMAAGRELKVDAVLETTMQRDSDRIKVNLRLVRVSDGSSLWSGKVDERVDDVFAVQDRVSEKVARALLPQLSGNDTNLLAKHYTQNREAHDLYMRGIFQWYTSATDPAKKQQAIKFFNQAIEKDPDFALAYAALANTYMDLSGDAPPTETMPKAKEAALKALQIDDTLADSHRSLGIVKAYYDWDWAGAEKEFKRAIELDPNSLEAHRAYSLYLTATGRSVEALAETKRIEGLGDLASAVGLLFALAGAREYDQLIAEGRKMEPNDPYVHFWTSAAYGQKGMHEEAITEAQKAASLSRGSTIMKAQLGYTFAVAGRRDEAENILSELKALAAQRYVSPYDIALIYVGLGDKEQAFAWLEKAYQEHARRLWALNVNPSWDKLRSDPRFADLLRRIGLS